MCTCTVPFEEPDEPVEDDLLDPIDDEDDSLWDIFLPDDQPYEPVPEPGDFWIDVEGE